MRGRGVYCRYWPWHCKRQAGGRFQYVFHNQAARDWARIVDRPHDRPNLRRDAVGRKQARWRCGVPIYFAIGMGVGEQTKAICRAVIRDLSTLLMWANCMVGVETPTPHQCEKSIHVWFTEIAICWSRTGTSSFSEDTPSAVSRRGAPSALVVFRYLSLVCLFRSKYALTVRLQVYHQF